MKYTNRSNAEIARRARRRIPWLNIVGCGGLAGMGMAGAGPDAIVDLAAADKSAGWLKLTFDLRARYEYADIADPALVQAALQNAL